MDKKILIASEIIRKYAKDGDVVNINGHPSWYEFWLKIAYNSIRKAQRSVFGKYSEWQDTHTMIYFDTGTFSVEPPKAKYIPISDYAIKDISLWRYTKHPITQLDSELMKAYASVILGTNYDYGQLLNILINQLLGYPFDEKVKWFDFGGKQKVCSVGFGAIYNKWTKGKNYARLFNKLNEKYWSKSFYKDFYDNGGNWNIENYYPANVSNPKHFDNEFELILRMRDGEILYKKT